MTATRVMKSHHDLKGKAVEIKKIVVIIAIANGQGQPPETGKKRGSEAHLALGINAKESEAVQIQERDTRFLTKIKTVGVIEKGDMIRVAPGVLIPLDLTETCIEVDEVALDRTQEKEIGMVIHPEIAEDNKISILYYTYCIAS